MTLLIIKGWKTMFSTTRLFVPAALILTSFLGVSAANAQGTECYTLGSLQGNYAVIGNYGANLAIAFGERYFDGNGNLAGTYILNEPTAGSTTGARTIATGTQKGTYTVNCDGTGVINRILTQADGTTTSQADDFLITGAVVNGGQLIATALEDAQRTPSAIIPGGIFLTRTYTRLPDAQSAGCYTLTSLQGSYSVVVNYGANVAVGLQPESLDGKGNLTRTGINNQPTAGSATGDRTITNVTSTGTYTVNCNGTGTITRIVTKADGTTAPASDDFIVTQAIVQGGQLIATTIVDAQRDPSVIVPGGIFVTRIHTPRPALPTPAPPVSGTTTAVANPKNAVTTNFQMALDGTASASADGKPLTFSWTQPASSPVAAIIGPNTATPLVQFTSGPGTYTFTLTVTDSTAKTATDTTSVTVQNRPRG